MGCSWVRFRGDQVWFYEKGIGLVYLFLEDFHYFRYEIFSVRGLTSVDERHDLGSLI